MFHLLVCYIFTTMVEFVSLSLWILLLWYIRFWIPTINNITLSDNSTLIDNIFVNKQNIINITGILSNEISDHQAVVVNINLTMPPPPP